MTDRAPDLAQALIGYRAWRVKDDGHLLPWTLASAGPWKPGVNTARCEIRAFSPGMARRRRKHRAPAASCMCGIYALTRLADPRLQGGGGQLIGAIAAWGDVEVHRDGFRAEHAAVVALALPSGLRDRPAATAAAERYGVALVAHDDLEAAAAQYGAPLDPSLVPRAALAPAQRTDRRVGDRGFALDEHVWAEPAHAHVDLGPTDAFRELVGDDAELTVPPPGTVLAAGDVLAVVASGERSWVVWACVSGTVVHTGTWGAGPLVRIADSDWTEDQQRFAWGAHGELAYDGWLHAAAGGRDVFADIASERLFCRPAITNGADVLRELQRLREAPAFASAAEVYAACAPPVHERIAADPQAAARAARAETTLRVHAREPDAVLTLTATSDRVALDCGPRPGDPADLVLQTTAEDAARLFGGTLDVAAALRAGRLESSAPPAQTLRVLSLVKHVLGRG